ncbi:MAG: metalloregulator ArsR/SmtB family transcription factor [bacterium]
MKKKTDTALWLVFKALSNENRLRVFEIIRRGHTNIARCTKENMPEDIPEDAVCVCEILKQMDVTAPTLSHHLKELRNAGIVNVYNRGQWSYYEVRVGVLEELADYFTGAALAGRR